MLGHHAAFRFLVAGVASAFFAACGPSDAPPATGEPGAPGEPAAAVENPATISGVINFAGDPPPNPPIDMSEEPVCADKHATPPAQEEVVVHNGKLGNVFVYVKEGLEGTFSAPAEPVDIDQDGCEYIPRVTGAMVGQQIAFENSDGILHNIKATPANQPGFNISQPTTVTMSRTLRQPEVMVPIQCDVHGWMHAYVGVLDHPYFAVSGEDGSFTIANLPPGSYTIETWHERYGTQTQEVTVGPNETANVSFDYSTDMAGAAVPLGEPIDPHGSHGAHVAAAAHTGVKAGAQQ